MVKVQLEIAFWGKKAFKSMTSLAGVTSTCEMQRTVLEDGWILNVIDTPGLFDFSAAHESIGDEIVKCITMTKDGIHAVLVVLSVRSRFSREEEAAIDSMRKFFGSKISYYMIVVFTGGDDLEENEETLNAYLTRACPEPLKVKDPSRRSDCRMKNLLYSVVLSVTISAQVLFFFITRQKDQSGKCAIL